MISRKDGGEEVPDVVQGVLFPCRVPSRGRWGGKEREGGGGGEGFGEGGFRRFGG
jgi:hypothetical protein